MTIHRERLVSRSQREIPRKIVLNTRIFPWMVTVTLCADLAPTKSKKYSKSNTRNLIERNLIERFCLHEI